MARLTSLLLAGSVLGSLPLLVGCNAIFGINEGKLGDGGAAGQSSQGGNAQGGQASQGGGGQGAGNTSGGGGEGGGNTFNACDPTTFTDGDQSQTVGPDCGLFVDYNASGAGPGSGTKNDPFKTLEPAMAAHGAGVPIFISGQPAITASFVEARSGAIYGGLTSNWSRDLTLRPTIAATAMTSLKVPFILNFAASDNYLFESLVLVGADASSQEDGISAGLLISKGNVRVQNSLVRALRGGPGHGGTAAENGFAGVPGQPANGCPAMPLSGGQLNCADGANVNGGDGSTCSSTQGSTGGTGNGPLGGGMGGTGACTGGQNGPNGQQASSGTVGPLIGNIEGGTFDLGAAPKAPDGVAGGGGGGGGARAGFGGAGGGSGGCGGIGGGGGGNGGASVPIVAFNANVDIVTSKLEATGAGNGGNGGTAGNGSPGAGGGAGVGTSACGGGKGGNGGNGGNGAGGNGGVGALVVSVGGMLTVDAPTAGASNPPAQANGGIGAGAGANKAPDGVKGLRCMHLHFLGDGNGTHDCLMAF